jgi:hypothetical protein
MSAYAWEKDERMRELNRMPERDNEPVWHEPEEEDKEP